MRLVPAEDTLEEIGSPDSIRSSDSITFIYSLNDGKFYSEPYPQSHADLIYKYKINDGRNSHANLRKMGFIFGRIGQYNEKSAIAFYGNNKSGKYPPEQTIEFVSWMGAEPISQKEAKLSIAELIKRYPNFDYEDMHVILMSKEIDEVYKLEGVQSGNYTSKQDDPRCKQIGVSVNGQEMSIKQILSNLHMVRGDQFEKIKHGFCPQSQKLDRQTRKKCPSLNRAINYIGRNLKCGQDDYQNILNQGKQGYRQQLKNVFGNPDAMDSEFRTQKDMDKAWDFYRKAESVMGFEQWMKGK